MNFCEFRTSLVYTVRDYLKTLNIKKKDISRMGYAEMGMTSADLGLEATRELWVRELPSL